jgi:1-acyl-sn-glycerol-3-phosphate acyltransferase
MFIWLTFGTIVGLLNSEAGITVFLTWVQFFKKLYGIDVQVINDNDPTENLAGCVFTLLNQNSLLDGPIGLCAIPRPWRGIVNFEYVLIPFFGWVMVTGSWVIIRQWPSQTKNTLAKVEAFLQNKGNIWMSIEGKRSKDGSLSKFKKGPIVMAIRSQAKIVPVIISGTREVLGYGKWKIRSGTVKVRLLKVVHTKGMKYEDRDTLVKQLSFLAEREVIKGGLGSE